jgi:Malectin domain
MIAGYTGPSQKDSAGDDWAGDQYSHGSWALHYPTTFIGRTSDPLIFRYGRAGDFSYDIPLKPGLYELHLYFLQTSETDQSEDAENKAVSNVAINRKLALASFDIVSDAMGRDVADERVIHDVSPGPDGILHLHLSTVVGTPSLSAIKILEGMPHKQFPIRIITQPTSFTDSQWTGVAS